MLMGSCDSLCCLISSGGLFKLFPMGCWLNDAWFEFFLRPKVLPPLRPLLLSSTLSLNCLSGESWNYFWKSPMVLSFLISLFARICKELKR